jgi:hypothetical protein
MVFLKVMISGDIHLRCIGELEIQTAIQILQFLSKHRELRLRNLKEYKISVSVEIIENEFYLAEICSSFDLVSEILMYMKYIHYLRVLYILEDVPDKKYYWETGDFMSDLNDAYYHGDIDFYTCINEIDRYVAIIYLPYLKIEHDLKGIIYS